MNGQAVKAVFEIQGKRMLVSAEGTQGFARLKEMAERAKPIAVIEATGDQEAVEMALDKRVPISLVQELMSDSEYLLFLKLRYAWNWGSPTQIATITDYVAMDEMEYEARFLQEAIAV